MLNRSEVPLFRTDICLGARHQRIHLWQVELRYHTAHFLDGRQGHFLFPRGLLELRQRNRGHQAPSRWTELLTELQSLDQMLTGAIQFIRVIVDHSQNSVRLPRRGKEIAVCIYALVEGLLTEGDGLTRMALEMPEPGQVGQRANRTEQMA